MSVETHRVLMGTCGWKHQAWLNDFYEEDLPEEWQLGFYSNEFPVVYVPAADWLDVSNSAEADLTEWAEDVADSFRFVLEIPETVLINEEQYATALQTIERLGEYCLGVVLQLTPSICNDTALIKKRIETAKARALVCIDKSGQIFTAEINRILTELDVAEVWDGKSQRNENMNRGKLAVCRLAANELAMTDLKNVVAACLSASTENCISVLCLEGDPPSLEKLRNADIILNLL